MRLYHIGVSFLAVVGVAMAQAKPAAPGKPDSMSMFLMMGAVLAIMYFLMIRPEQKKQKDRKAMLETVKKGSKVITNGGIYGVIQQVKDNSIMVKVADGVSIEFAKSAILSIYDSDSQDGDSKSVEKKS